MQNADFSTYYRKIVDCLFSLRYNKNVGRPKWPPFFPEKAPASIEAGAFFMYPYSPNKYATPLISP